MLDLAASPQIFNLSFDGIKQNADGLYSDSDFMALLQNALDNYVMLQNYYNSTKE